MGDCQSLLGKTGLELLFAEASCCLRFVNRKWRKFLKIPYIINNFYWDILNSSVYRVETADLLQRLLWLPIICQVEGVQFSSLASKQSVLQQQKTAGYPDPCHSGSIYLQIASDSTTWRLSPPHCSITNPVTSLGHGKKLGQPATHWGSHKPPSSVRINMLGWLIELREALFLYLRGYFKWIFFSDTGVWAPSALPLSHVPNPFLYFI